MAKDIDHELRTLRRLPYGVARTSATEALVRRLETEGPEQQLPQALLDLVEAYTFANLGKQGFVAFARTLRLWDSRPELFDEADERNLFWEFKWIAGDLPDYPEITAEQADAFLADMTHRFAVAGKGGSSVRMSRFRWAWHTGSADMEQARLDWITGDRDELEDCTTCTVGQQTDYFTELGRFDEAVAIGTTSTGSCNLEPTRTMHALALAALRAGDAELATRSYRRALATYSKAEGSDFAPAHGQAFELLAVGGAIDRALQQLRSDTGRLLLDASTPLFRLRFLLGVLSGLSANLDRSDLPTGLTAPAAPTLGELHAWVRAETEALAAQFDRRNGTDYYAGLVARALASRRSEHELRFGTVGDAPELEADGTGSGAVTADAGAVDAARSGSGAAGGDAPAAPGTGEPDDAAPIDARPEPANADDAYARAETQAGIRDYLTAAEDYARAAALAQTEGRLEFAGVCWAESAKAAEIAGDAAAAHERYAAALPRLEAAGTDDALIAQVLVGWAPVAAKVGDFTELVERLRSALARTEASEPEAALTEELAESRRLEHAIALATLRDTLARSLGAAGSATSAEAPEHAEAVSAAQRAGEEFAQAGRIGDAAHAFWLAGRLQRTAGDTAGAVWSLESAFEGFAVARLRDERAHAAGELIEVLRETGQSDRADAVIAELGA